MPFVRTSADGIELIVRLTPRASRDAIEGVGAAADGKEYLQVRVRAVPAEGAANAALIALLAKALDVPKSTIRVVSGAAQRLKRVEVMGAPSDLARRATQLATK